MVIRSDAEQFEIYKANGEDINLNRFLSMLIVGYYNGYKQERNETAEAIRELVAPHVRSNRQKDELTEQIMEHAAKVLGNIIAGSDQRLIDLGDDLIRIVCRLKR